MKSIIIGLISILFSVSVIAQSSFPSVELKTLNGETVNIQDYISNGKLTVISFWATWCSPCKKELDALMDFYPDWKEAYDLDFLAITIDDARGLPKVGSMVAQKGWDYTILSDLKQELKNALSFQTVPQMYIVNSNGEIVYNHSSYVPGNEYELDEMIAELAAK
jgi:peroxiredoxin